MLQIKTLQQYGKILPFLINVIDILPVLIVNE